MQFVNDISMIEKSWDQASNFQEDLQKQLIAVKKEKDKVVADRGILKSRVRLLLAKVISQRKQLEQIENQVLRLIEDGARRRKILRQADEAIEEKTRAYEELLGQHLLMKKEMSLLEEKLKRADQENALLVKQKSLAIEEFLKSEGFYRGIEKVEAKGQELGFKDCLNKVKRLYLELNLSTISLDNFAETEKGQPSTDLIVLPV